MADIIKDMLLLKRVWRFMLPQVGIPCIPVFEDSQGAIQLAQNSITKSNSKYFVLRHHFIRELVARSEVLVSYVDLTLEFQHRLSFIIIVSWSLCEFSCIVASLT